MLKSPPITKGVLDAVSTLLQDADVLDYSGFGGLVIAEGDQLDLEADDPLEQPEAAADGFWWRIISMEVINGIQAPEHHMDNVRGFRFYIRIDVMPPNDNFDAQFFLEGAHNKVYHALHYKRTTIEGASQNAAIIRKNYPSPMFRDDRKGYRYMTAEYFVGLGPLSD